MLIKVLITKDSAVDDWLIHSHESIMMESFVASFTLEAILLYLDYSVTLS